MTISAFLLASPGFFLISEESGSKVLFIFIGLVFSWGCLELFISISRPFKGVAPSHPLIKLSRMLWLLFAIYAWFDYKFELTKVHLPFWILITLVLCYLSALIIRIYAVKHLGPTFSYDVQKPESGVLNCSGPYRIIRHPSYLGICILGSLPGLILGSIIGFIGMMLTTLTVTILRVNFEDILLQEVFGQTFNEYKNRTYSLIPFIF